MKRSAPLATLAVLLGALSSAGAVRAQAAMPEPEQRTWLAVSHQALDRLRGGFDVAPGLTVSFGITRAVALNGQLLASTTFQVDDLAQLAAAQAGVAGWRGGSLAPQVVQNGPGNTLGAGAAGIPLAIYVQNTLDQQTIGSHTVIHAASSGMGMARSLNLQATLSESIHSAIRNR